VNLLRRFVVAGLVATAVDIGLLLWLANGLGWPVPAADVVAVGVATIVSWVLHGLFSFPASHLRRWYHQVRQYAAAGLMALIADVAVITVLDLWLDPQRPGRVLVIKIPALFAAFCVRTVNYRRAMSAAVREDQREPIARPEAPGSIRLSVVIPAYDESDRIATTIERVRSDLAGPVGDGGLEIIVVDDGSSDGTAEVARTAGADRVVTYQPNRGKGAAVRAGVLEAVGRTIAFTDADLSYAPAQIVGLMEEVESGWDVVVGSRKHTDTLTVVRAGRMREAGGRLVNVMTGIVLLGGYRDTQCGLKAMRSDVARLIFTHCRIDGFAFDVEIFHLVERYRLTLVEAPVEVVNSSRSTVHVIRDAGRLVVDLFRIRTWARLGQYEVMPEDLPARI
jgi:dolichyl-phosphate beta-glucosyltransferase